MPGILSVADLEKMLNPQGWYPSFETVAPVSVGVFDALKAVAKEILEIASGKPVKRRPTPAR